MKCKIPLREYMKLKILDNNYTTNELYSTSKLHKKTFSSFSISFSSFNLENNTLKILRKS